MVRQKEYIEQQKKVLFRKLSEEGAFWSYNQDVLSNDALDADDYISLTLRYLDLEEIEILFQLFPYKKIKDVWKDKLIPEGEYLYTLNRFFAWYYFKAKRPDAYIKYLQTRHLTSLLS